ncbi:MAG: phenylpyruvate tautomerase MIF-related protein [Chitinivibrionales bacterium]
MPFIRLSVSAGYNDSQKYYIMKSVSEIVAEGISKPERAVMVEKSYTDIISGGEKGPAAFAEIRSIGGLNRDNNESIMKGVSEILNDTLNIPGDSFYANFMDVSREDWGVDNRTFAS